MFSFVVIVIALLLVAFMVWRSTCVTMPPKALLLKKIWEMVEADRNTTLRK